MSVSAYFHVQQGTTKTFKSSGGDAAITLASLANATARQSVKLDLGAIRGATYSVKCDFELAATPTAGNLIKLYWSPSASGTAGTDNAGGASGADAAYSGYSSNLAASEAQLPLVGVFVCTAQATATVQKSTITNSFIPPTRYGSLIVDNGSGAAFHSSDANCQIVLIPNEELAETTAL